MLSEEKEQALPPEPTSFSTTLRRTDMKASTPTLVHLDCAAGE